MKSSNVVCVSEDTLPRHAANVACALQRLPEVERSARRKIVGQIVNLESQRIGSSCSLGEDVRGKILVQLSGIKDIDET